MKTHRTEAGITQKKKKELPLVKSEEHSTKEDVGWCGRKIIGNFLAKQKKIGRKMTMSTIVHCCTPPSVAPLIASVLETSKNLS